MKSKTKGIGYVYGLILPLLLAVNFFWSRQLLPGFDSPFYLDEIRSFYRVIPNYFNYQYNDRYFTMLLPAIMMRITGVNEVVSYKLTITLLYCLVYIILFCLLNRQTKDRKLAVVLSLAIVISPFFINYFSTLYANFFGLLILLLLLLFISVKRLIYKYLFVAVIYLSAFFVHNFSSVYISLVAISYLIIKLIFRQNRKTAFFLTITSILFIVSSLFLLRLNFFGSYFSMPTQPVLLGDEKQRVLLSFVQSGGKYWLYYFFVSIVILFSIGRRQIVNNKDNFVISLSIFIPSFILSLQPFYNMNYLPERFSTLIILSSYFFYISLITLPKFKNKRFILSVIPLLLNYLSSDGLILNKGYQTYTDTEIKVYKQINDILPINSTVLLPSDHEYWGRYFLDGHQIVPGDSQISCGKVNNIGYFGDINFTLAKLLAENDPHNAKLLFDKLKVYYSDVTFFILTDTNVSCGHGKILHDIIEDDQIFNQENWHLYEIN